MRARRDRLAVILTGISSLAFGAAAQAQTAPAVPPAGPPIAPAEADKATGASTDPVPAQTASSGERVEDIIVTGSRVIQNGNNSPTPLTVVSSQQLLESTPTTVASALQQLPVFQNSVGQNTGTGGGGGGPNGAANAPNIRSLGLYRTLTLFDGKRLQPTTDTGLVTIDMFPQMLLQRSTSSPAACPPSTARTRSAASSIS